MLQHGLQQQPVPGRVRLQGVEDHPAPLASLDEIRRADQAGRPHRLFASQQEIGRIILAQLEIGLREEGFVVLPPMLLAIRQKYSQVILAHRYDHSCPVHMHLPIQSDMYPLSHVKNAKFEGS